MPGIHLSPRPPRAVSNQEPRAQHLSSRFIERARPARESVDSFAAFLCLQWAAGRRHAKLAPKPRTRRVEPKKLIRQKRRKVDFFRRGLYFCNSNGDASVCAVRPPDNIYCASTLHFLFETTRAAKRESAPITCSHRQRTQARGNCSFSKS